MRRAMKTSISKTVRHSLLIDEDEFGGLFDFLSKQFEHVELTANCLDGSTLETEDVTEILEFENLNYRRITEVIIMARSGAEDRIRLSICSDSTLSGKLLSVLVGTRFSVSSQDDKRALYVSEEIIKRLKEMKPWYDLLARSSVILTLGFLWGACSLGITLAEMLGFRTPRPSSSQLSVLQTINIGMVLTLAFLAVTCPIEIGLKHLFPRIFFLFGKQKKTMETIEKWRSLSLCQHVNRSRRMRYDR